MLRWLGHNAVAVLDGDWRGKEVEKSAPKFALSLPKGANVDRFVRIAQSAALNNDIAGCSPRSIMSSIDAAMRDGLVLDGREAALVSFSSKGEKQAQYMPMVGGLKKKMLAAEGTKSLSVGIIYQGEVDADRFAYYIDETGEHFRHDPLLWGDRGEAIGAYAVLTMTNGGMFVSVMRRDEIEQRKAVSRAASSPYGPWAKWPLEMWKKTVLRSLAKLAPSGEHLVKHLIYPVPDPTLPFLGVHFTRMISGGIEAGPNAVLAFKREGYSRTDFSLQDAWETLTFPGLYRFLKKYPGTTWSELRNSFSKDVFLKNLQRLIPDIRMEHISREGGSGVRAQAIHRDGSLLMDFSLEQKPGQIHLLNAPSPGATASLAIGNYLIAQMQGGSNKNGQ